MTTVVLGVDVGGTGVRARLAHLPAASLARAQVAPVGETSAPALAEARVARAGGARLADLVAEVAGRVLAAAGRPEVRLSVVGCAGAALLGPDLRAAVAGALTGQVVICSDLLTAYVGAAGFQAGVVLAAGTGAVALGTDRAGTWNRVDGWGHLLGDDGGGAWIGREGMRAAYRALDGRPGGSLPLLEALRATHGDPGAFVAGLTAASDRSGILAAFAPAVIAAATPRRSTRPGPLASPAHPAGLGAPERLAHPADLGATGDDDPVAAGIVRAAAGHLADTLLAALPEGAPARAWPTGNLLQPGSSLTSAFGAVLRTRRPELELREAHGAPLDGAVALAAAVLAGPLPPGMAEAGALSGASCMPRRAAYPW
ncbi:hypothetical protein ACTI_69530 [Actinoplanes sp. OR16]|uniref:BadF/BadG/BcrA/BcrD ATPase family protein n=1 Tax=Actinoplanes sp. OR16 TaxID=946334 RepID=UPI000F6FCE34|nr:BadF/BadG/BcrA/BcrD ATPase family protein [Actinoplanes sp. OR16]BBH70268.1 hypothetical protein ACTI_69530 [Actinoplanes sp. OR16]